MTQTTPLTQSPHEDLLNALQIAQSWAQSNALSGSPYGEAFVSVIRLVRDALTKLGDPHPHTVELTRRYLEASWGRNVPDREAEDFVRIVVTSALKWEPV